MFDVMAKSILPWVESKFDIMGSLPASLQQVFMWLCCPLGSWILLKYSNPRTLRYSICSKVIHKISPQPNSMENGNQRRKITRWFPGKHKLLVTSSSPQNTYSLYWKWNIQWKSKDFYLWYSFHWIQRKL